MRRLVTLAFISTLLAGCGGSQSVPFTSATTASSGLQPMVTRSAMTAGFAVQSSTAEAPVILTAIEDPSEVLEYNEIGQAIALDGGFAGTNMHTKFAYDKNNGLLYAANLPSGIGATEQIVAYNRAGSAQTLSGSFSGIGSQAISGMVFDPYKNVLYVASPLPGINGTQFFVFDDQGNSLPGGWTDPNLQFPSFMTFDSKDRWIYVSGSTGAPPYYGVYNEKGERITLHGTFATPDGNATQAIAYDEDNDTLYAVSEDQVYAFDTEGNIRDLKPGFPHDAGLPNTIAFDPANRWIYVGDLYRGNPIRAYNEHGHHEKTGSFLGGWTSTELTVAF